MARNNHGIIMETFYLVCYCIYATFESLVRLFTPTKSRNGATFRGEVAVVTGAGHGIGKELSLQLAQAGAKIVCWDINEQTAEQTAMEIVSRGGTAWSFKCDVSDRSEVSAVAQKTRDTVGEVSMLFNNAGIMPCKPFLRHSPTDIERVYKVNVFSQFWTLNEFLPDFIKHKNGHVICLSSTAGIVGAPNLTAYCSTKYALRGLMDALYLEMREMGHHINLTVVHPFTVNTGLAQKPTSRFTSLFPFTEPAQAAKIILDAVQAKDYEVFVPTRLFTIFALGHLLPFKVKLALYAFAGCGVEAHEN